MKNEIFGFLKLGLTLLMMVCAQGCSAPTSTSAVVDSEGDIDTPSAQVSVPKIPTKSCTMNGIAYQCVTISYGEHTLQNYELWLPNTVHISGDRPLVVYFHGGGYYAGDKVDAYLKPAAPQEVKTYDANSAMPELLQLGYAVATVNYRLVDDFPFVYDQMEFPVQFQDAAWAVQDLRMRAAHYDYNTTKVAFTGVSAGGGLSLWLAFHDDLINFGSVEIREKFSSKADCVAVRDTQTTIHISEIGALLGPTYEVGYGISTMFGFTAAEYAANPALYEEAYGSSMSNSSAIHHLNENDATVRVMLSYVLDYGTINIHAAEFGRYLAEGNPVNVKNQYGRKSLFELGMSYTLKTKQAPLAQKNNMINHINSCFSK